MRLLICTQTVDLDDPILGFFHRWIEELAGHFSLVTVICLREGKHALPRNVDVLSLSKERSTSRITRVVRFFRHSMSARSSYDCVFVHMNQEYVLMAGWLWWLLNKRVYMWRNHYQGSVFTDIAASFCARVFCTSKFSYTAKYRNTALMPVGIDVSRFQRKPQTVPDDRSLLFLARMAPSKKPHLLIEALAKLQRKGVRFSASFYGDPTTTDAVYYSGVAKAARAYGLESVVKFYKGIANAEAPAVFSQHAIFVNCSTSGMLDKTIFEAMACESLVLAPSQDYKEIAGERYSFADGSSDQLVERIESLFAMSANERADEGIRLRKLVVRDHSLAALGLKLSQEMKA